jgi:hypothetical protein
MHKAIFFANVVLYSNATLENNRRLELHIDPETPYIEVLEDALK